MKLRVNRHLKSTSVNKVKAMINKQEIELKANKPMQLEFLVAAMGDLYWVLESKSDDLSVTFQGEDELPDNNDNKFGCTMKDIFEVTATKAGTYEATFKYHNSKTQEVIEQRKIIFKVS